MRRIILAVAAWCALAGAAAAQEPGCTQSVAIPASAAGTVKLVADPAAGSSSRVYVCGYTLTAGTAASTAQLIGGTGAACVTSLNAALTGVIQFPIASPPVVDGSPQPRGMATQPGAGLCLVVGGTGPGGGGVLYYTQK